MRRRHVPALLAATAAPAALAQGLVTDAALDDAVRDLVALPGETALLLEATSPKGRLRQAHRDAAPIFVGSATKTFILGAWLRAVEAGRLSLTETLAVDDAVRSPASPVLGGLTGTASAQVVLEAMIAHSDNTATDIALHRVGPGTVRALIAERGLSATRIPDSTRIMFSTMGGAPPGTDLGWAATRAIAENGPTLPPRPAINEYQTMVSTGRDMVAWYAAVLEGKVFAQPGTLDVFKRIQMMADAMPRLAPPDVIAYGKGGSISWGNFQALALAGRMVAGAVTADFFFAVNWPGDDSTAGPMIERLLGPVHALLARSVAALA